MKTRGTRLRKYRGASLLELVIASSATALVFVTVCAVVSQLGKVYKHYAGDFPASTSGVSGAAAFSANPQAAELHAFQLMQYDLRDAMRINAAHCSETQLEVVRPLKTDDLKLNEINYSDGVLVASEGSKVRFFLGIKQGGSGDVTKDDWTTANQDPLNGDTLFRVEAAAGSDITPADGPFDRSSVKVIVTGLKMNGAAIFTYKSNALVNVKLSIPQKDKSRTGWPETVHTMQTQFALRNVRGNVP